MGGLVRLPGTENFTGWRLRVSEETRARTKLGLRGSGSHALTLELGWEPKPRFANHRPLMTGSKFRIGSWNVSGYHHVAVGLVEGFALGRLLA